MYLFIALLSLTMSFLLQSAVTQHSLALLHHSLVQLQMQLQQTPPSHASAPSEQLSLKIAMKDLTNQLNTLFPTPDLITTIDKNALDIGIIAEKIHNKPESLRDELMTFWRLYDTRLELLKHRLQYKVDNENNKKLLQQAWQAKQQSAVQSNNPYELAVDNLDSLKHTFTTIYTNNGVSLPPQEKELIQKTYSTLINEQKGWTASSLRVGFTIRLKRALEWIKTIK